MTAELWGALVALVAAGVFLALAEVMFRRRPRRQLDYQQGWDDGYRAGTTHEREADTPVPRHPPVDPSIPPGATQ